VNVRSWEEKEMRFAPLRSKVWFPWTSNGKATATEYVAPELKGSEK
jgi:hypothetical protein